MLQSDSIFNSLKHKIDNVNVNFMLGDIFNMSFDRCFDNINLSNIATYYKLDRFKLLFDKLEKKLNINGQMLVSYLYDTDIDIYLNNSIYDLDEVYKILSNQVVVSSFIGNSGLLVNNSRSRDSSITYKKVKKI